MKSVGEAMAIGRTFKESLQKALRSMETGAGRLQRGADRHGSPDATVRAALAQPRRTGFWYRRRLSGRAVASTRSTAACKYDPWFLEQIQEHRRGRGARCGPRAADTMRAGCLRLKQTGFSDSDWPN